MDTLAIIVILTFILLCIAILLFSVYAYIFYSHEKESSFPGSRGAVVNIILSIFCSFFIFTLLPLDWINEAHLNKSNKESHSPLSISNCWAILSISSIFLFLANIFWKKYYNYKNPYRPDKNDPEIGKRVKESLLEMLKYGAILSFLIIFASFVYGGKVQLTYSISMYKPDMLTFSNLSRVAFSDQIVDYDIKSNFTPGWKVILSSPFIFYGTFMLFIIGGFGMATVPVGFIASWVKRPQKPNAENMVISDLIILKETEKGINKLKDLIQAQEDLEEIRREGYESEEIITTKIENIDIETIHCQEMLIKLEELLHTQKRKNNPLKENPLKYLSYLLFGIFSAVVSIIIVVHTILSAFHIHNCLENVFYFLLKQNLLFPHMLLMFLSVYMLFCTIKGYEKLSELFPHTFGHNQMQLNRTWIDTFLIIANIFIPSSWAILAYFLRFTPQFFNLTSAATFISRFVLNVQYIKIFFSFRILHGLLVICFMLGIVLNCSLSITVEELDQRVYEAKESMKYHQLESQKSTLKKDVLEF